MKIFTRQFKAASLKSKTKFTVCMFTVIYTRRRKMIRLKSLGHVIEEMRGEIKKRPNIIISIRSI
jgi:hypothetical protein